MHVTVKPGRRVEKMMNAALSDPEQFWSEQARNLVWFKEWDTVLDWKPPYA
jgi:acetyl-CoA synthetase